ncbi:TPR domain-containing protein, partial [Brachyspira hampsonii 30599]
ITYDEDVEVKPIEMDMIELATNTVMTNDIINTNNIIINTNDTAANTADTNITISQTNTQQTNN